jgi:hypothetical protein
MSTLLRPAVSIKTVKDPELPPVSDDEMSPERVHARLCTLAEACRWENGQSESSYLAGSYRVQYERLYDELRDTRAELARVQDVLSRVEDAHYPDELPEGDSYAAPCGPMW